MKCNKVFRKDLNQTNLLVKVGKESGRNAVRRSKAMDLTVIYIENGKVIEEQPDGSKNQIDTIEIQSVPVRFKKGMILHGKQKESKDFCWS